MRRSRNATTLSAHDLALPFDLDRARALLAEVGYPDGRGLPELRLLHVSFENVEGRRREREAGWQQWNELGVPIRQFWIDVTQPIDYSRFAEADLWEWSWNTDYPDPDGMLGTFLETQPTGRDAETERLITRARSLRSRDERLALYREADRRLVAEQVWLVPACYRLIHRVHRPWLDGVWTSPAAISPLNDIVVRDRESAPRF
jgi:oligopeptide transport system substrate-binding protein